MPVYLSLSSQTSSASHDRVFGSSSRRVTVVSEDPGLRFREGDDNVEGDRDSRTRGPVVVRREFHLTHLRAPSTVGPLKVEKGVDSGRKLSSLYRGFHTRFSYPFILNEMSLSETPGRRGLEGSRFWNRLGISYRVFQRGLDPSHDKRSRKVPVFDLLLLYSVRSMFSLRAPLFT